MSYRTIHKGGFFDRHPILVPGSLFAVCWVPYIAIFFRRTIAFGDLGNPYPVDTAFYWFLFIVQLGVCVISHSLTIRTIVRLYAPRWLIWGSVAFYALSPAWGLMTVADIRHPLFAAVFCVFTSSCVFALYSKKTSPWLWVQLGGGALSVCLLRAEGIWIILPTLLAVLVYKVWRWWSLDRSSSVGNRIAQHFRALGTMDGTSSKKEEARWSDVCAAFLVLSAVGLLFLLTFCIGWALPLGEPDFGRATRASMAGIPMIEFPSANLTGTDDVGSIIPFAAIGDNSIFQPLANDAAKLIFGFQCLLVENLTFSWVLYLILFGCFFLVALWIAAGRFGSKGEVDRHHDFRPLILGLSMAIIIGFMAFVPGDVTLRYLMPVLAAQPMFFGASFASMRG